MKCEEEQELEKLRKEMDLSSLGDRTFSISANKLRRLIELERKEIVEKFSRELEANEYHYIK